MSDCRCKLTDPWLLILTPVVRACLAMEYPPRLQIHENGEWSWGSETGYDGEERVPDQEYQTEGYGLVHFDLDPKNGEHSHVLSSLLVVPLD